jgi:hypothetical protein
MKNEADQLLSDIIDSRIEELKAELEKDEEIAGVDFSEDFLNLNNLKL